VCLDARHRGVDEFDRLDVAAPDELGQSRRVVVAEHVAHVRTVEPIRADQWGTRPPLTTIVWPETNAASSESR
jgi:hypothetical protein